MAKGRLSDDSAGTQTDPQFSYCKLMLYALGISIGSLQFGYALGIYSPISKVWMTQYSQDYSWSIYNKEPNNTLVNTVMYIGAFLGAFTASIYVRKSRVHGIYIFNLFCIVGSLLTDFIILPLLYVGRFIHGYGAGCFSYLIPIMFNEISPPKVRGAVTVLFQITVTLGILIAALIGFALPHTIDGVTQNDFMPRLLAGLPIAFGALQILEFMTCHRYDTPQSYLARNDSENAKNALNLVYTDVGVESRLQSLEMETSSSSSTVSSSTLKSNSTKAVIVCVIFSILQQMTGINGIIFYSSQIFANSTNEKDIYDGIIVAVLVGSVNYGSTLLALIFVERLGRKLMLIIGFFAMAIFEILTGIFDSKGMETPEKVSILLFIAAFQFSAGPLLWAYMPEVLNSAGVTLGAGINWLFVIVISVITPQMADNLNEWMFYFFAIFNVIAAFFSIFFIVESKGRTKLEINRIYDGKKTSSVYYSVGENERKTPLKEDED